MLEVVRVKLLKDVVEVGLLSEDNGVELELVEVVLSR